MDARMLSALEQLASGLAPVSESEQISLKPALPSTGAYVAAGAAHAREDVLSRFEMYIKSIVDSLCAQYGCSDDEGLECVIDAACELSQAGRLPPIPDQSDLKGLAAWHGKAATVQMSGYAHAVCHRKKGGAVVPSNKG